MVVALETWYYLLYNYCEGGEIIICLTQRFSVVLDHPVAFESLYGQFYSKCSSALESWVAYGKVKPQWGKKSHYVPGLPWKLWVYSLIVWCRDVVCWFSLNLFSLLGRSILTLFNLVFQAWPFWRFLCIQMNSILELYGYHWLHWVCRSGTWKIHD